MDKDINEWLTKAIVTFVEESSENQLGEDCIENAWDSPLVGFSRGDDALYSFLKEDIGDFYMTPYEFFTNTFPHIEVTPEELSVISWVLPQTNKTKEEQRKEKNYPTNRAVLARVNGERFNRKISEFIIDILDKEGYQSVSPMLSSLWKNEKSPKYGFASTWSERHTAYVSGLGTFGLSDMLITSAGKAMRCGSVIARIKVKPTKRRYTTYTEYCLFYKNGGCMKCAERCPANAINENGHDKRKCREYQINIASKHTKYEYNMDSRYCGICQFGVPCESGIPDKI